MGLVISFLEIGPFVCPGAPVGLLDGLSWAGPDRAELVVVIISASSYAYTPGISNFFRKESLKVCETPSVKEIGVMHE